MAQARTHPAGRVFALVVLAVALAYIEADVVVYLRAALLPFRREHFPQQLDQPLPLGSYDQLRQAHPEAARLLGFEVAREVAAITVLLAAACGFGRRRGERVGLFLLGFAIWDIFYYVFLRILIGWPASLWTWDVLFLIPVPWVAPVWAPLVLSVTLVIVAGVLLGRRPAPLAPRRALGAVGLMLAGVGLILASFFLRLGEAAQSVPRRFDWPLFLAGWVLGIAGVVWILSRPSALRR